MATCTITCQCIYPDLLEEVKFIILQREDQSRETLRMEFEAAQGQTPQADTDLTSSSVATRSCDSSCSQTRAWLGSRWALYEIRLSAGLDYMLRSSARGSSIPTVGTDMPPVTCPGLHPGKLCKEKRWTRIFREELEQGTLLPIKIVFIFDKNL